MTSAAEVYGKELTASAANAYAFILRGYSQAQVRAAVVAHMSDPEYGRFYPTPADLIRQIDGDPSARRQDAWLIVLRAIEDPSLRKRIGRDHKQLSEAVDSIGGWSRLRQSNVGDLGFIRKDFMESLRAFQQRAGYEKFLGAKAELEYEQLDATLIPK